MLLRTGNHVPELLQLTIGLHPRFEPLWRAKFRHVTIANMTAPGGFVPVQLPLIWPNINDVPVLMANVFMLQGSSTATDGQPDDPVLTIGQAPPPVLLGTPEEQEAMMGAIGGVQVHTICRVALTRGRVLELMNHLRLLVVNMDAMAAQVEHQATAPKPEGEQ